MFTDVYVASRACGLFTFYRCGFFCYFDAMNKILLVLSILLALLQYRLWVGEGSLAHLVALKRETAKQQIEVTELEQHNHVLIAEVKALKSGNDLIEEKARTQLGMIKDGETFYMFSQ